MSDNIKVVVKVRPLIPREIEEKLSYQWRVKNNTLYQLDQNGKDYGQCFTFDKVYDKDSKTTDVYHDIAKPIVEAATAGFNGTIFAYGQTSSGKTYTMTGTENSPGIIPLAVLHLFETIKNIPDRDFLVRVSYIEIYNETLKDLLSVEKKIKIHDTLQGVKVDATEKVASSPEEVLGIMKEGEANRQVGATNMNEESSRSHSIFQITIESREHIEGEEESGSVNVSQLNLVDLAGSERAGQTGATGIRFKEGTHINKSLSVLALVIKQLSEDRNKYANYRDSKLTRILQNSLGGNAKTSIICAVTPAAIDETISTLQFANRAKAIKNKPEVNAVATNATMIQSLTKQLSRLQSQLESKKNLEQDNYKLTKQIVSLQRLILNGFGQRNPKDLSTNRRKTWCAPRRMTISTLHPIEEDPVPVAPKFCTPVLKYNPMVTSAEFIPIQNTSKLTTVSEESTSGLITPTPLDKKVNFNDEIIELDSDDDEDDEDESTDVQTCSPYHKCYGSSKTPPCVLRRNAKQAEKSLQDLVELTDREKIYSPTVVELIEKLEQNTIVITKLEDEIESLNDKCKDKDSEINTLKDRINKTEEEVKTVSSNKLELEAQCKEFKSRLTDWEVSYETLQKRAKSREEELLSLLNEKTVDKVSVDIGKPSAITLDKELANFMNMSKDMSLVNSDNESSITNDEESSTQVQDLVTVMQKQLTDKNQIMIDLEAKLNIQKHRIEHLEHSSKELQEKIVYFNNKLSNVHHENAQLKSTIDALNLTIKNQREHLETVNNDIESYNALIHELQIKVNERNNKLNVDDIKIDDYTLETMIANEEKFIANNENLKNIIQSMKIAIESRNTEITNLKHKLQSNTDSAQYNISLQEQLENKEKQIISLIEETEVLKKQLNENVEIINELIEEKNKFKNVESQLINKLETENANYILKMQNKEHLYQIDDSNKKQQEIATKSLEKQIEEMAHEIVNLKNEIDDRDSVIDSLKESDNNKLLELSKLNNDKDSVIDSLKECENNKLLELSKAKILIPKLQDIILLLTGDVQEIPEEIDSTNLAINTITDSLEIMNNAANEVILERDRALENNIKLNNDILNMVAQHQSDIDKLKLEMDNENKLLIEIKRHNKQLTTDLETVRYDLEITNKMNIELETELNSTKERNENLRNDILYKDNIISALKEKESNLYLQIQILSKESEQKFESLKQELDKSKEESINQILQEKGKEISELSNNITKLEKTIEEQKSEIKNLINKLNHDVTTKDQLLQNIFNKVTSFTTSFHIENSITCEFGNTSVNIYEHILLTLDKIANHIEILNSEKTKNESNIEKILSEARLEIRKLTQHNLNLMNDYSEVERKNQGLLSHLNIFKNDKDNLKNNLLDTQEIVQQLQNEVKLKAKEIESTEIKALEWKDKFVTLDNTMKQRLKELEEKNLELQMQYSELKNTKSIENYSFIIPDIGGDECYPQKPLRGPLSCSVITPEQKSPQSLLTLCCNKIIDYIQPDENEYKSITTSCSSANIEFNDEETQTNLCQCNNLTLVVENILQENSSLKNTAIELESENQLLLMEQEEVRKELKLMVEQANDLHRRILNHRTNLSTLSATTHAENKLLKSQVTVLQHRHNRFHSLCQRDIPAFKEQLVQLMTMLKGDSANALPIDTELQNVNFNRYMLPDVVDENSTISNFKNDSTLDGDLLMLDTNDTLSTSNDNTLMGHEQSSLNITLVYLDNGVTPCQANNLSEITDSNTLSQIEKLKNDNYAMSENLKKLIEQNNLLKVQLVKYLSEESSIHKKDLVSPVKYVDNKHDSSHHLTSEITATCSICEHNSDSVLPQQKLQEELKLVHEELTITKSQKEDIERKFNNLSLEIPATDALINKLNVLKKEYDIQSKEINKLNGTLNNKCKELKQLQEENDILSTQMMESISESDDLRKELDNLKAANEKLTEKCVLLETTVKEHENTINSKITCPQCLGKNYLTCSVEGKHSTQFHPKLNRSHSDSDRSSRCNKLCTLQNELHESKEDCKKITEEVATIKNQLENNMSMSQRMDLDDSMTDSAIFTFTKDLVNADSSLNKFNIPDITEERSFDVYSLDKADCFNYYVEKTCNVKGNLNQDFKIIDIMKMLYNHLTTEHKKEVEDLVNKLKDFEESKNKLQIQLDNITANYRKTVQEFNENDNNLKHTTNVFSQIRNNINTINEEIFNFTGTNKHNKIVLMFKENLLRLLDAEFSLSSVSLFECLIDSVINKHQEDLNDVTNKYTQLQRDMENVVSDLNIVNENLVLIKNQLSDKENDYNLLKAQKERLHEISNAVTLDIIKKEKELNETIATGCRQLLEHNIMKPEDIDLTLPLNKNINLIFERLTYLNTKNIEKENLALAVKNSKTIIEEKDKEIESLKVQKEKMQEINKNMRLELVSKENQLLEQKASLEDLNKNYRLKIEENSTKLKEETKITELMEKLKQEVSDLKSTNQIVMKEKDIIASELQKSGEIIKQNNKELDKMTSDILILRESVKENMSVIENLKEEAKLLLQENIELKEQLEQKCRDCSRLELNIKTHEKTAEVQSGIIMRLKKQKDEDSEASIEKDRQLVELTKKYVTLQRECETMKESITQSKEEFNILKNCNKKLETKVNELQVELENIDSGDKPHKSIERITEHTRRRRQTIHDSKRTFVGDNLHDQDKIDEVFAARSSSDDLFMEVDCDSSNRSTPIRLSKDRDSVPNKQDQTDKDEEHSPRPSSVVATRRRRQSIHDLHRNALQHTPSPHGKSSEISGNANDCISSESQLKERIASCVQELEELKERYRELDEECETCAEYLRERDEQCQRLKNEKTVLENRVTELQDKLKCVDQNKHGIAHASVNTDEDWTNLHSVVVDRMSYDAEVEKNKKLTKALEEFRYKNRELKATLAKMQDKFENITSNNEESQLKTRLSTCMRQLEEIQQKYKELDEECEVCAQYLREKEELCARLKKENNTLMEQMIDMKKKIHYMSPNKSQYNELKFAHACVNTDEDWANLHAVVVDRMSFDAEVEKNKKLTKAIEEFHLKNRQLKATVAKMQKALEKNTAKHNENDITELQSTNAELELCKKELEELKEKYKELDEECETCAEYLRERDEQCRKLKEAKIALETKLQELQEESNRVCAATAARKKRRSLHDQSREPLELSELSEQSAPRARAHAATDTGDDFLSYQVERDNARRVTDETHMKEMYRLKKMVEKLTEQKTALEHQLLAFSRAPAPQPVYVATGSAIVQNQQLTDIMKENQKLKRINAKLVSICKKRGKPLAENRENDDPAEQG